MSTVFLVTLVSPLPPNFYQVSIPLLSFYLQPTGLKQGHQHGQGLELSTEEWATHQCTYRWTQSFAISQHPSMTLSFLGGMGAHKPLPIYDWMFRGSVLCRSYAIYQLPWVHKCHAMPYRYHFKVLFHMFQFLHFFHPSSKIFPQPWKGLWRCWIGLIKAENSKELLVQSTLTIHESLFTEELLLWLMLTAALIPGYRYI